MMLDRLVYSRRLVVPGVQENLSLCIVAVDHRQPQRWNEKLTLALEKTMTYMYLS